jgi:hypothetical protein
MNLSRTQIQIKRSYDWVLIFIAGFVVTSFLLTYDGCGSSRDRLYTAAKLEGVATGQFGVVEVYYSYIVKADTFRYIYNTHINNDAMRATAKKNIGSYYLLEYERRRPERSIFYYNCGALNLKTGIPKKGWDKKPVPCPEP